MADIPEDPSRAVLRLSGSGDDNGPHYDVVLDAYMLDQLAAQLTAKAKHIRARGH